MTNWYKAQAMEIPTEYDTTSSPTTVYQRKEIKQVTVPAMDGEKEQTAYEYMERQMTQGEYSQLQAELESPTTKMIMQELSAIQLQQELITEMMEV